MFNVSELSPIQKANLLREAKFLIVQPRNWVKSQYAVDELSYRVHLTDEKACKFCAMGAMYKALYNTYSIFPDITFDTAQQINSLFCGTSIGSEGILWQYNDWHRTTHNDIMVLFDDAIAYWERENEENKRWERENERWGRENEYWERENERWE